jgi:hypothetical protein
MDEEFESFVVTDPDIVDEGIDVSGLRTQTDVSPFLLGNIPDYAGIQYEAFNPSRLSDLMRLYSSGLPAIDTSPAKVIQPGGGSGDGGQATLPGFDDPTPEPIAGFDPGVTPGPSGFIGLDPDMDIDPRDIDDYGTYTPPTTPVDNRIQIENISADPYSVGMDIDDPGASIENLAALQTPSGTTRDIKPIQDLPMAQEPLDIPTQDVGLAYTGEFDPDDEGTVFDTSELTDATPEQRNTIQNILTAAGDNVQGALTQLGKIPGAVVDFANQTVDFFGKKLNVGKTLAGLALNKMVGGPATLVFELAKNILPEGNIAPSTNIARSTGLLQGDTTVTKDKYGINTQTSFDPVQSTINYNEYNVEQVEDLNNALTNLEEKYEATWNEEQGVFIDKKTGLPDKKANDMTNRMRTELKDRKEYLGTINKDPLYGGDIDERDQMLEDIVAQNKIDEGTKFVDTDGGGEFDTTPITTDITSDLIDEVALTGGQLETGVNPFADIDTGVGEFDTTPVDTTITGTLGPPSEISGPQITEEKPVDTKLADDRAVDELSYDQIIEYENLTNKLEGEEIQKTGNPDVTLSKQEEIKNKAIDQIQENQDIINKGGGDDIGTGGLDPNRGQQVDRGSSGAGDNQPVSTTTGPPSTGFQPQSTYDAELEDDRDVGGGGNDGGGNGGGGKIVCTMMNESYGFGSFRNKIWLKHSKGLAPEYQKGYHKIFLPLVKLSKKNIFLKKILEHIAVHRTIDIRQESRGKMHLLGRVYRKILEPICYFVGKHG